MTETASSPALRALTTTIPALTGLRAIASLAIVLTHVAFWTGNISTSTMGYVWSRLDFGVALFFALSGFLLFRPWVASLVGDKPVPSTGRYARHRALRILPVYWVAVLAAFAFSSSPTGNGVSGLLSHLSLTQIYGDNRLHNGVTQTWSLATEMSFYLALPFLGWVLTRLVCRGTWRPVRLLIALGVIGVANVAWLVLIFQVDAISLSSRLWLPSNILWFAVGMALTVLVADAHMAGSALRRPLDRAQESPATFWLMGVALLAMSATPIAGAPGIYQDSSGTTITRLFLYAGAAALMMAPLVADSHHVIARVLSARPLQWLGEISYELFLVHVLMVEAAMALLGNDLFTGSFLGVLALTLVLSLPASRLLYRLVEVPLSRFRR